MKPKPNESWARALRDMEPHHFVLLGGGFVADLTATEYNQWMRYMRRGEHGHTWRERERYCELLRRAIAQDSTDAVTLAHRVFFKYDWLVYELAEAWYAELVKARAAADESDKGEGR